MNDEELFRHGGSADFVSELDGCTQEGQAQKIYDQEVTVRATHL